jgi:hypothetical protein
MLYSSNINNAPRKAVASGGGAKIAIGSLPSKVKFPAAQKRVYR